MVAQLVRQMMLLLLLLESKSGYDTYLSRCHSPQGSRKLCLTCNPSVELFFPP
jgi:hypothetical protein